MGVGVAVCGGVREGGRGEELGKGGENTAARPLQKRAWSVNITR